MTLSSYFIFVFLQQHILYLAGRLWQKLLLSSFTRGILLLFQKVRSTVARNRFWQSIYQYFKSRSLHATQINFHKIRFSQIMFTNSDPYPIFLPAKFDRIRGAQIQQKFSSWKKRTKSDLKLFKAQLMMMKLNEWEFSAFEIQIFCLTGRSLSYLYWKIQNPTPRRKIEFLTDCCFNFQFNLGANEYINSNVHRARERKRVVRSEAHCRKVFRIPICLNRLLSHLHLDYNDMAGIFVPDMEDNERSGSR